VNTTYAALAAMLAMIAMVTGADPVAVVPGTTDLIGDLAARFGPMAGLVGYLLWWLRAKDAQAREDSKERDRAQLERLDAIVSRLDKLADRACPLGRTPKE